MSRSRQYAPKPGWLIPRPDANAALERVQKSGGIGFVHGLGGVGKTMLLDAFCSRFAATRIDVGDVPGEEAIRAMRRHGRLVIDGFESINVAQIPELNEVRASTKGWLIVAGRTPAPARWIEHPLWPVRGHDVPLGAFDPDQARALLDLRGVPQSLQDRAIALTHAHPLALALLATELRRAPRLPQSLTDHPDVLHALLQRILRHVPGQLEQSALHQLVLSRRCSESTLQRQLDCTEQEANRAFFWLTGLDFARRTPAGLQVHDLARDVIVNELRWRAPTLHGQSWRRAIEACLQRRALGEPDALADLWFLLREHPLMRNHLGQLGMGRPITRPMRASDSRQLLAAIGKHFGEQARRIARNWLKHPAATVTVAQGDDRLIGAWMYLDLRNKPVGDVDDPACTQALAWLARRRPALRKNEGAVLLRFWFSFAHGQAPSPETSFVSAAMTQASLEIAGLAYTLGWLKASPQRDELARLSLLEAAKGTEFECDGVREILHVRDWRATPAVDWLQALALGANSRQVAQREVTQALRWIHQPERLGRCTLAATLGLPERAVQQVLSNAINRLQLAPADRPLFAALNVAFVKPVGSDKAAAKSLALSISGYRKRVRLATARLTEILSHQADSRE